MTLDEFYERPPVETYTPKPQFWRSAEDGLQIIGHKAYSLNSAGDPDGEIVVTLPISHEQAKAIVRSAMYHCEAPQQADAMSALTGKHYSVCEGGL